MQLNILSEVQTLEQLVAGVAGVAGGNMVERNQPLSNIQYLCVFVLRVPVAVFWA